MHAHMRVRACREHLRNHNLPVDNKVGESRKLLRDRTPAGIFAARGKVYISMIRIDSPF